MSRPSSSVPHQCCVEGDCSRFGKSMCAGSCGAIQGAKIAENAKMATNTTPMAANGLWRATRGSETARVDMGIRGQLSICALFTENQAAQLIAQTLRFSGIARISEALGELEKRLLSLFPRFDAQLDELHQDTVIAQALALRHTIYLFSNGSGEGHAPSDMFGYRHGIIIHQFGALSVSPLIRKGRE